MFVAIQMKVVLSIWKWNASWTSVNRFHYIYLSVSWGYFTDQQQLKLVWGDLRGDNVSIVTVSSSGWEKLDLKKPYIHICTAWKHAVHDETIRWRKSNTAPDTFEDLEA